ncbi:MAG: outer membrane beta-barrel protein [Bacteroidia bacterium]
MKKSILFVFVLIYFSSAKSQELDFGMRAGITRSSMVQNFADFGNSSAMTGFTGGFYLKAKILGFFVMPEIVYNKRGGSIQGIGDLTTHYIDVPLLVGKQFFGILRVNGGPVLQYAIANDQVSNKDYVNNSSINNFVVGLQAGVGVDIWKLSFDIRYDTNISSSGTVSLIANNSSNPSYTYSTRASMWVFTLGYRFIKI